MSISSLFESGFIKRNKSHFAAIIRVAMSDGVITEDERSFLDRLALKLDISEDVYKSILKDYKSYPINPPSSYDKRLERLYDLARMVWVDDIKGSKQYNLLHKLCIALGFDSKNAKQITDKALSLTHKNVDLKMFVDEMKLMEQ